MLTRSLIASCLTLLLMVPCGVAAADERPVSWAPVPAAMLDSVERQLISGSVTLIASKDKVLQVDAVGLADVGNQTPMKTDSIFAIASMTKLVTATAIMMLVDEGKLSLDDPIGKFIPELAHLKTADGVEHVVTLKQVMTHTSGMGEITADEAKSVRTLGDLIPLYAKKALQFEPGTQWLYCQSGINSAARIIEIISGQSFDDFLQKRLFDPLGMNDTTYYPTKAQIARIAKSYKRKDGKLEEAHTPRISTNDPAKRDYLAAGNAGLFSTAPDFARLCQMVLNGGELGGKRYLRPETVRQMTRNQIAPIPSKHVPGSGFGIGWCVITEPQGQTAALSPGSHGHGGAYGTLVWIDPDKGLIFILMIQRADFGGKKDNLRDIFMHAVETSVKGK